jgi:hypothetical protein
LGDYVQSGQTALNETYKFLEMRIEEKVLDRKQWSCRLNTLWIAPGSSTTEDRKVYIKVTEQRKCTKLTQSHNK